MVRRGGVIATLTIPTHRPAPSAEFSRIMALAKNASAESEHEVRKQIYCSDLLDEEKEKIRGLIDSRRSVPQESRTPRQLSPIIASRPDDFKPPEDFDERRALWERQIATDSTLPPLAREIGLVIVNGYLHRKRGPKFFRSWISIEGLSRKIARRRQDVRAGLDDLKKHGHCNLIPQGVGKSMLIEPLFKPERRSASAPSLPAEVAATPLVEDDRDRDEERGSLPNEEHSKEQQVVTPLPELQEALKRGVAFPLRRAGHAPAPPSVATTGPEAIADADKRRVAAAKAKEADEQREQWYKFLQENSTSSSFDEYKDYNPLACHTSQVSGGSPLPNPEPLPSSWPSNGRRRRWYED